MYLNSKHPNHKELNTFLLKEYSKANDELIKLNNKGKPFTVWDIHARIKQKSSSTSLFAFEEEYIIKITK